MYDNTIDHEVIETLWHKNGVSEYKIKKYPDGGELPYCWIEYIGGIAVGGRDGFATADEAYNSLHTRTGALRKEAHSA
jgi:hypothetical protein